MRKLLSLITFVALVLGAFFVQNHWVRSRTLPTVSHTIVNDPDDLGFLKDEFKGDDRPVVVLETSKDCGAPCDDAEALLATHAAAHPNLKIVKVYYEPPPFASIGYVLPSVMTVVPGYGITSVNQQPNKDTVDYYLNHRAHMGSKEISMVKRINDLQASAQAIRAKWQLRWRQLADKRSKTRADRAEMRQIIALLDRHAELSGDLGNAISQAQGEFMEVMHAEALSPQ